MSFWGSFLGLLFRVLKGLGVGFYFLGWVPDGQRLLFLGGAFWGRSQGSQMLLGGEGRTWNLCVLCALLGLHWAPH